MVLCSPQRGTKAVLSTSCYRCSQGSGLGGGLHMGGEPGQHQLRGEGPPWRLSAVVQGRPAAAIGQQLQHQDPPHSNHQLPGGELDPATSPLPRGSTSWRCLISALMFRVATDVCHENFLILFLFPLLQVNPNSQNDFGSYNCSATNVMGTESKEFLLISAGVSPD